MVGLALLAKIFLIVMSNRSHTTRHGMHRIERRRPSSSEKKRREKAAARPRAAARNAALAAALAEGNS